MRVVTPADYVRMTPMERLALDAWIEAEGIGPVKAIAELRVWDDGRVVIERFLYDVLGTPYGIATITHEPAEPMP